MKSILLALFLISNTISFAGWEDGNAGDTFAAEFTLTARDLAQRIKLLPISDQSIDPNALLGTILNTEVHSEEKLFLNGYEVDAINYPDRKKILVSRSRWRPLRQATETKARLTLVLHEYLYMMRFDDNQFRLSERIISLLDVKDYNPSQWWNPLNPSNYLSLNPTYTSCKISGIKFDTQKSEEILSAETSECEEYRKIVVHKDSSIAPPSTNARGTFHRYEVTVLDKFGKILGFFTYEPQWGLCLLPQDGTCRLTGKILSGDIEFNFWLLR